MAERILIPLDGSELGEAALKYVEKFVVSLAPGEKVEVVLFHAVTQMTHAVSVAGGASVSVPYTEEDYEEFKSKASAYLTRVGGALEKSGVGVSALVELAANPAEAIIKAEEKVGADLVAMSTHGRTGLSRWAFGSVTDKVLRAGKVPVLMVRAKEK